jgi:3-deoxy-D-arabino-heptulosonate 7-phosphate (DAHP) synthase
MTMTSWIRAANVGRGILATALLCIAAKAASADPIQVITPEIHPNPKQMMSEWYKQQTSQQFQKWDAEYEKITDAEAISKASP